ncbi:MAG: N-acetyl-gamma-glutamyl-phosphate reductase [Caldilineaceae bacterium]|nr:N-acetyl-gamma-glutamyl-phosphate reductase [Caldilineaceae bacterium]
MIYKAGIAGATGYTGLELVQLIQRHPQLEVGWITSESSAGKLYSEIHAVPWDFPLLALDEAMQRADEVDVVFLCLPHAASIEPVRAFSATGVRVVDLSADYRIADKAIYERWYGVDHTAADLLDQFVYGLSEVYREQLRGAQMIANPGCYPTTVNLALYPLAQAGWLGERIIVDSKSGVSGAGRKANLTYSFVEAHDNMKPYNIGYRHRHIAEMEQVLNTAAPNGSHFRFTFSPHLLPVNRGMLSTIYLSVADGVTHDDVRSLFHELYADEPFIHLLPAGQAASLRHVTQTNRCAIGIHPVNPADPNGPDYIITSAIDNLLKGASGQALQNFNIAVGLDETLGLL